MKNILIPTDLSVQSLWPIHDIVNEANNEKVNIYVVHLLCPPTSITDLLFLREPYDSVPEKFTEALELLRNKYNSCIGKITFQLLYCTTSRYLNNFIEGKGIDEVYMLTNYNYDQALKESEKCVRHFNKCKVPVKRLPLHSEAFSEYQILSALLNGTDSLKTSAPKKTLQHSLSFS